MTRSPLPRRPSQRLIQQLRLRIPGVAPGRSMPVLAPRAREPQAERASGILQGLERIPQVLPVPVDDPWPARRQGDTPHQALGELQVDLQRASDTLPAELAT